MRKLASIVTIREVKDIPWSDTLSVASMQGKGWQVVIGRDSLKPGDRAVYFEIDSALPPTDSRFDFLKEKCLKTWSLNGEVLKQTIRIKTMKIRGVVSQGLLMPLTEFPELANLPDGEDVTARLGVEHYDEVAAPFRAFDGTLRVSGDALGEFPEFIPKTDEERIQNLTDCFETMKGKLFEVTSKDDGCSMTVYFSPSHFPDAPFGVCSRNKNLKDTDTNSLWEIARKYQLPSKLAHIGRELAFQGEFVGPGCNGNRDLYRESEWHVFRIWDIENACFLLPEERRELCLRYKIPHVPVIEEECPVFDRFHSVEEILAFAEGKTVHGHEREGLVFKEIGTGHPFSFKAVSNRYLLKLK